MMNLELGTRFSHLDGDAIPSDLRDTAVAGLGLRGFGGERFGLFLGIDARFGGGVQGGFAYNATLAPIGFGMHLDNTFTLGANIGAGVSGVTEHIEFAVHFPVEVRGELRIANRVHVVSWGKTQWITASKTRQNGAEHAPFGDELEVGLALRVGRGGKRLFGAWGNGIVVGATYSETLGRTAIGVVLAYGISMSFSRPE